ncbi:hypothetical protein [Jiangella gansuensis]|uniref:hypothetical protein n=1 Tax=Jiangella gansuensis TaxID=281473 RepID=UPI0004BB2E32|nr:hypothetical protein [Jiangella gansuensis]
MNVVLLATGRLPRSYFTTVRADLGDDPDLELDVIAWAPPREPLGDTVRQFVLLGPGRMPVAPPPEAAPAAPAAAAPAAEPATAPVAPAAPAAPARKPPARPPYSPRRIAGGLKRRAGAVKRKLKKSPVVARVKKLRTDEISREYWSRLRSREDALAVVRAADIVIALDSRSVRAGWYLARRPEVPTVVLGVQAAIRERAVAADRR